MLLKLFATAGVAALLMAGGAIAQENASDVLLPKKNQSQGASDQGGQQPDAAAGQKDQSQGAAGGNADAGQGGMDQQQNAQGADEQNGGGTAQSQSQDQPQDSQNAQSGQKDDGQNAQQADQNPSAEKATGSVSRAEDITVEKRKVIRERLVSTSVTKIERSQINFDINVGVSVPTTIVLNPLPLDVVEIVPAYRGYQYFLLADGTIVIVEPSSLQIVFVLSA